MEFIWKNPYDTIEWCKEQNQVLNNPSLEDVEHLCKLHPSSNSKAIIDFKNKTITLYSDYIE